MTPITISAFAGNRSNAPTARTFGSLRELAEAYPHTTFKTKHAAPLISPAMYPPGASRGNESVIGLSLATLDFDHQTPEGAAAVIEAVEAIGLSAWVHSTYSHTDDAPAFRVAFDVTRPILPAEWRPLWLRLRAIFPTCDPACKDAARAYYVPSTPEGEHAEPINAWIAGEPLDVDALLAEPLDDAPDAPRERAPREVAEEHAAPAPGEVTPEVRSYCHRQLEAACEAIRTAPFPGPIHETINTWAFRVGTYTPHILPTEDVRGRLRAAHRARTSDPGLVRKNDGKVDVALEAGALHPWRPAAWVTLTERGIARHVVDRLVTNGRALPFRYVDAWGGWVEFDGARWSRSLARSVIDLEFRALIDAWHEECQHVPEGRAKKLASAIQSMHRHAFGETLIKRMTTDARTHVDFRRFESDHFVMVAAGQTIDLRTGETIENTPEHFAMHATDVPYDRDATCPRWERFMLEVCRGDVELVDYLHRAIGYTLTGSTREQVLFYLYGSGANGKGVFFRTLGRILGEYATTLPQDALMDRHREGHPTVLAGLHGMRAAFTSEVNEGAYWNEALLKSLTGEDVISARRMREDFWTFRPTHKLWISGNHKPLARATDHGFWRRLHLIPFAATFDVHAEPTLPETLDRELPGILAWAVRGCLAWQRHGLEVPACVKAETRAYREESDDMGRWIEVCLDVTGSHGDRIARQALHASWVAWCAREGIKVLGTMGERRRLYARVASIASAVVKVRGDEVYTGIKIHAPGAGAFAGVN